MRPRPALLAVVALTAAAAVTPAAARPAATVGPGATYEAEPTPLSALSLLGRPAEALAALVAAAHGGGGGDGALPTWPPPPPPPAPCESDAACVAACEGSLAGGGRPGEQLVACANAFRTRPAAFTDTLQQACPAVVTGGDWPPPPPGAVRAPLGSLDTLSAAAASHAADMAAAGYFDHTPPSNSSATPLAQVSQVEPRASRVGQLIAAGWETPGAVLTQLACTPTNRRILFSCGYDAAGAGAAFPQAAGDGGGDGSGWDSYFVLDLACVSPGGCPAECPGSGSGSGGPPTPPAAAAAAEAADKVTTPVPGLRPDPAAPPQTDYVWEKVKKEEEVAGAAAQASPLPTTAGPPPPPPTTAAAATAAPTSPPPTTAAPRPPPPATTAAAPPPPPPPPPSPPPTTTTPPPTSPARLRSIGSGPPARMCTAGGVQLGARGPPPVVVDGGSGGDGSTTTVFVLTLPSGGRRPPVPDDFEVTGGGGGSVIAVASLDNPAQLAGLAYAVAVVVAQPGGRGAARPAQFTVSLKRGAAAAVVGAGPNTTALAPTPLTLGGVVTRGVVAVTAGVL